MYSLYGEGDPSKYDEDGFGYYIEVNILAGIGNKPSGGGDISIEEMWFRVDSIDDPERMRSRCSFPELIAANAPQPHLDQRNTKNQTRCLLSQMATAAG